MQRIGWSSASKRRDELPRERLVRLGEESPALRVAEDHGLDADRGQHRGRDLAGVGAGVGLVHVLRGDPDRASPAPFDSRRERCERRADHDVRVREVADVAEEAVEEVLGLLDRLLHLPVRGQVRPALAHVTSFSLTSPSCASAATPGSSLPFQELERRAAPGREPVHVLVEAERDERGRRVAAADDRVRRGGRDRLRDAARPGGERLHLERAHRAVPKYGSCVRRWPPRSARSSAGRCRGPSSRPAPRSRRSPGARRRR